MDGRNEPTSNFPNFSWRHSVKKASTALSTSDGRWAVVSTSLSAVIVGSVAWLAMGTLPPTYSLDFESTSHQFLPYRLFQELNLSGGNAAYASVALPGSTRAEGAPSGNNQLDMALATEDAGNNQNPGIETHTVTLDSGDTLAGALEDSGITAEDANAAVTALAKVFSPRSLRAGQSFDLTYGTAQPEASNSSSDDTITVQTASAEPTARLLSIAFSPSVDHDITVTRAADGSFTAADTVKQLIPHVHRAGTTIDSSLYLSAMRAGIPADVVVEMIHMFSYKVDFQRDIHPGDSFEVYYDYYYTPQGQPAREGNISYAMMKLGGREIALYRYQSDPNQPADYFDAHGRSAKGMLMKTPVDGARITSGFGMRFHPILGYTRMHKGEDFGVPIGTPVMAAGAGTIAFVGWEHGYGKFVLLNNGNAYSTAYGHLSRFAPGLHVGSRVRQGQVIAYSGMTGMATGPHLHYEVRINNQQVNPATVKVAQGRQLIGKELRTFQVARMHIDDQLAAAKLETKVADLSTGLRAAAK